MNHLSGSNPLFPPNAEQNMSTKLVYKIAILVLIPQKNVTTKRWIAINLRYHLLESTERSWYRLSESNKQSLRLWYWLNCYQSTVSLVGIYRTLLVSLVRIYQTIITSLVLVERHHRRRPIRDCSLPVGMPCLLVLENAALLLENATPSITPSLTLSIKLKTRKRIQCVNEIPLSWSWLQNIHETHHLPEWNQIRLQFTDAIAPLLENATPSITPSITLSITLKTRKRTPSNIRVILPKISLEAKVRSRLCSRLSSHLRSCL